MGLKLKTAPSHLCLGDEDTGEDSDGDGRVKDELASENTGDVGEALRFLSFDECNFRVL